jgi:hypothetical protein
MAFPHEPFPSTSSLPIKIVQYDPLSSCKQKPKPKPREEVAVVPAERVLPGAEPADDSGFWFDIDDFPMPKPNACHPPAVEASASFKETGSSSSLEEGIVHPPEDVV